MRVDIYIITGIKGQPFTQYSIDRNVNLFLINNVHDVVVSKLNEFTMHAGIPFLYEYLQPINKSQETFRLFQ